MTSKDRRFDCYKLESQPKYFSIFHQGRPTGLYVREYLGDLIGRAYVVTIIPYRERQKGVHHIPLKGVHKAVFPQYKPLGGAHASIEEALDYISAWWGK